MNDFIVTIPSDFHSNVVKDNKISKFKIVFDNPFNLNEDYFCGLVEIIYPTSVRNIPEDIKFNMIFDHDGKEAVINKYHLSSGSYETSEKIIDYISNSIQKTDDTFLKNSLIHYFQEKNIEFILPKIEYSNERVKITEGSIKVFDKDGKTLHDKKLLIVFDDYLHFMLGFEESNLRKPIGKAKYPVDLFGNNHTLYLYTNIINESYVGNIKSQLLRVIPLEKATDKNKIMKSITFNPILFYPLRMHKFDLIEIQIRDSTGRLVIFERGRVVITLMFKKQNQIKYE